MTQGPDAPGNDALASVVTHIKTGGAADPDASIVPGRGTTGLGGMSSDITFTGTAKSNASPGGGRKRHQSRDRG